MMKLPRDIRKRLHTLNYTTTKHFTQRRNDRDLRNLNLTKAIINGEVIERLYRFGYGELFIVCCEDSGKVFHVVVVANKGRVLLKTIYVPDSRFLADKKTRRDGDL